MVEETRATLERHAQPPTPRKNWYRSTEQSARHYPALDGLRGIAILAVFFSHYGGGHKSGNGLIHIWSILVDTGWIGVDLFFVLSGFLITGILFDTARQPNRAKNFYARRALRIFPLFYGVLFGCLLLTPWLHLHWHAGHLLYFVYLSNMMPVLVPSLPPPGVAMGLTHLWSLAVEEQFYLIWPFVVWLVRDRQKLLNISVAIMVASLALRSLLVFRGVDPLIIYSLLFTRADSLLCGASVALLIRGPAATRPSPIGWLLPLSGAAVVAILVASRGYLQSPGELIASPFISTVGYTIIAIFCGCLVYRAQQGTGWVAWLGSRAWLRFFGRYSYGLYVFHGLLVPLLLPLVYPVQRLTHSLLWGGILYLIVALGLNLAVAMLSYHLFEAPILRLKKHFV